MGTHRYSYVVLLIHLRGNSIGTDQTRPDQIDRKTLDWGGKGGKGGGNEGALKLALARLYIIFL